MSSAGHLQDRVFRHLRKLEEAGLRRHLHPPLGIDLSSNDYLGLASHPLLKQRMADAVLQEGCGSTASRLLRGEREAFAAVERRFAEFKETESSLFFGSGYAANLGVLTTFVERHDVVFTDEHNHASIVDGIRLSRAKRIKYRHCDREQLAGLLRKTPASGQKFLVTESLFSMDGDFAPLADYVDLCRQTDTILIVDEAHAAGIYGASGSGWIEHTGTKDGVFLSVNTAGKAMGAAGAFVAAPAWAVDFLVQRARTFIFSTAPPPALAAALSAGLDVIRTEPDRRIRLLERAQLLRGLLKEKGMDIGRSESQIVPVIFGANERATGAAKSLQDDGFDIRAIRPPAVPAGTARLRISVNAGLDACTIHRVADSVSRRRNGL